MENIKNSVYDFYENNKSISSPIFDKVKITPQSLWHLENKDRQHKRTEKEIEIRMKCFLCINEIIKKSHLYQEYKQELEEVIIKKLGRKIKQQKKVSYYGLVGVVKTNLGFYTRIKVVIKKVEGRNNSEFVSVIPAWNTKGYNRLYFEEEKNSILQ